MSGGGFRVSIPKNTRETIENLKEIARNHSEEEIYAMLKECSMDPNETAQKLLLQDPFHEVKSKRDKRKESFNNRESAETRWRPGTQGRGSRGGGRGNYSARYASYDSGGGKNYSPGKQKGNSEEEKGGPSSASSQEAKNKETPNSRPAIANGPTAVTSGSTNAVHGLHLNAGSGKVQHEVPPSFVDVNTLGSTPPSNNINKKASVAFGTAATHNQPATSSGSSLVSMTSASSSACDPVLVPLNDPQLPSAAGEIKQEAGSQQTPDEQNVLPAAIKSTDAASKASISSVPGKISDKSQGGGKNQLSESCQPTSATHAGSSLSRPSNFNNRSQLITGPQKVSSNKEWKPKSTNHVVAQGAEVDATSEVLAISVEASQPQHNSNVLDSEETSSKPERKLEELHLPPRQHVILPNHIHVPESERNKFSFGSFGANFGLTSSYGSGFESDKSSTPASENSHVVEETVEEQASSNQNTLATNEERDFPDQAQSATTVPENLSSGDREVPVSAVPEYNETKQDNASLPERQQYSVVHTSPSYNFGFVSPMLGSQLAPLENSESQERDVSRLPGFVVQQPYDPASYYAQFYRTGAESDGRVSPFPLPGVATKYNGNVAVLPPQTSQSSIEGANSQVLATAGLTQSSMAVTQQPVPVFRPPAGMHVSHYPPNFLPYGHYFSPYYVPPPMHQFLSNGYFPPQPQAGNVYPSPPTATAAGVKYPLPQYKPGGNTGNSTSNKDLNAPLFKDNSAYIAGKQSEGSAMWVGRDMSDMLVSSYYNLPPQGHHVTFAPTQAGHVTYAGVYHPAQAVTAAPVHPLLQHSQTMPGAADMAGPAANAYQQPQHSQINWPANY